MFSEKKLFVSLRFSCPGLCWPDAETQGQKVCLQRTATHHVVQSAGRQADRQAQPFCAVLLIFLSLIMSHICFLVRWLYPASSRGQQLDEEADDVSRLPDIVGSYR